MSSQKRRRRLSQAPKSKLVNQNRKSSSSFLVEIKRGHHADFGEDCSREYPLVTPNGNGSDDCLLNAQSEEVFLDYGQGRVKCLDYFNDNRNKLASEGYHTMIAKTEIPVIDSGGSGGSANNPNPSRSYYDDVKAWLEDAYHAWAVKDRYSSIRLLLLSFGLIGLLGACHGE